MASPEFDFLAHETEARLRDLRHLISEMALLTDHQETLLAELIAALRVTDEKARALRQDLLETVGGMIDEPPAPTLTDIDLADVFRERPREDIPYIPPTVARRLEMLREMREVAHEMGLPFDGEDELEALETGPDEDDEPRGPDDNPGSSRVPAVPTTPPPARPGGAERTIEEALAPPRNV